MSHEEFAKFVDPRNEWGKLLQSHFAALQLIQTPISLLVMHRKRPTASIEKDGITVRWLSNIHKSILPEYRKYYEWPLSIEMAVYDGSLPLKF
jgi:hypothetical protein